MNKNKKLCLQVVPFRWLSLMVAIAMLTLGCSNPSSPDEPQDDTVELSGVVYDTELSGAMVELIMDGQVIATTLSDASGRYSFNITIKDEDKGKLTIVQASRGAFVLRSVLGSVDLLAKSSDSGTLDGEVFAGANVTNVSTSMAAIIEQQNAGSLPTTQTSLDTLVESIQADATLRDNVKRIAAAVKSVIDYGVTNGQADTDALAKNLAASSNLANDLTTHYTGAAVVEAEMISEVENDPKLAEQLPETPIAAVADLANLYIVSGQKGKPGVLYVFDASGANVTAANATDISTGGTGINGSASYDASGGKLTLDFSANGGPVTVATLGSGNINAFGADVVQDGVSLGRKYFRRILPVIDGASSATEIGEADLTGTEMVVDFRRSKALFFPAACDNIDTTGWIADKQGKAATVKCNNHLGMLVVTPPPGTPGAGEMIFGLMPDSWDGTNMRNSMHMVKWEADLATGSSTPVSKFARVYKAQNSVAPATYPVGSGGVQEVIGSLRLLADGVLQLMFVAAPDSTPMDSTASGEIHIYRDGVTPKAKNHVLQGSATGFGSLLTNGSVNVGQTWDSHQSTAVSVNLGRHAGGKLNALFKPYNATTPGAVVTRLLYNVGVLTAADVSSKTLKLRHVTNPDDVSTLTFNIDGASGSLADASGSRAFTWTIAGSQAAAGAGLSAADYTAGTVEGGTVVVTFTDNGEKVYMFADKSAGPGNFVYATYSLDSSNNFISMAGYVAAE